MELRHYGSIVRKWWWLLLLGIVVAGASGYYFSQSQLPVYRASVTLLVNQARDDAAGLDYNSLLTSQLLTRTYVELIRKTPVLAATIEKLGLPYTPDQLGRMVTGRTIRDTQLLEISVEHENAAQARDIANTVAEVFIAQRIQDELGQSSASREVLRQQIADLEKEIKATTQALDSAKSARNPDTSEIARLQNALSQHQYTFSQLLRTEQEMRLAEARTFNSVKVAEAAGTPASPVRPQVRMNSLLAALAGLALALGFAFLREYLDDTVKAAADVQRSVELAILGMVGRIPAPKGAGGEPRLLGDAVTRSPFDEAYRILRVNVDFAWAGCPGQVIMLTSANPREGKTTTLSNLALALARDNRSVVMVDADLRRPSLHRVFGLEGARGLSNLLADSAAAVAGYLQATMVPNLSLLASGPIPPNPSELLGSPRFRAVLQELKQQADVVLVDTPPALAVADPALVAARADGVIVVVEAGAARVQSLVRAKEVLQRSSARVLGVVLNKLSQRSADYYYYYRHYGAKPGSPNGAENQRQATKA